MPSMSATSASPDVSVQLLVEQVKELLAQLVLAHEAGLAKASAADAPTALGPAEAPEAPLAIDAPKSPPEPLQVSADREANIQATQQAEHAESRLGEALEAGREASGSAPALLGLARETNNPLKHELLSHPSYPVMASDTPRVHEEQCADQNHWTAVLTIQRFVRGWLRRKDSARHAPSTPRHHTVMKFKTANAVIDSYVDQAEEFAKALAVEDKFILRSSWVLTDADMAGRHSSNWFTKTRTTLMPPVVPSHQTRSVCVMHPLSVFRQIWDLFTTLLVLMDMILVPLSAFRLERSAELTALELVSVLFWTLDIIASFFTGIYEDGELIMNASSIARKYVTSRFLFDLPLTVLDWIDTAYGDHSPFLNVSGVMRARHFTRFRRLLRIFQLLRIIKLHRLLSGMNPDRQAVQFVIGMFLLMSACAFLVHLLACMWYAVGDAEAGWVYVLGIQDFTLDQRYLTSMEWSVARLHPSNMKDNMKLGTTSERLLSAVATLCALALSSVFISLVTNNMSDWRRVRRIRQQNRAKVRNYASTYPVTAELSMRLKKYLQNSREESSMQLPNRAELAEVLPSRLYRELCFEALSPTITCHRLFNALSVKHPAATYAICHEVLVEWHASCDELLFVAGDACEGMLFVALGDIMYEPGQMRPSATSIEKRARFKWKGSNPARASGRTRFGLDSLMPGASSSVAPTTEDKHKAEWLKPGEWMCEPALWTAWQNCGEAVAGPCTTLLCLKHEDFAQVINLHGLAIVDVVVYARYFVRSLNEANAVDLSDLPMSLSGAEPEAPLSPPVSRGNKHAKQLAWAS